MTWPLGVAIPILAVAALATLVGGVRMTRLGDVLADRLEIGEALFGAVFFGAMISLSGIVMTATAATEGYPRLAFSNAIGGVAAQTAALGIADAAYRKANLEHAAASVPNMLLATVLIGLLVIVLMGSEVPSGTIFGLHPASIAVVGTYLFGVRIVSRSVAEPLWLPKVTRETVEDVPDRQAERGRSTLALGARFVLLGSIMAAGGWAVAQSTASLVEQAGIDESFAGAAIMGVTNALPETVVAVTAVRRGALTLALGGVLGGNAFDVLNVAIGDAAYRGGSIYHAAGSDERLLTLAAVLMTTIILAGLLVRERRGPANIGFEGLAMLVVYFATLVLVGIE